MSTPKRQLRVIVEHIQAEWPLQAEPRELDLVLAEIAAEKFDHSTDSAEEFGDTYRDLAAEMLDAHLLDQNERALPPRFAFNSSSPTVIQGYAYAEKNASDAERSARRARRHFDDYLPFLRELSWRDFEACCRGVLVELGCVDPKLTSKGNDQGVDFFGRLALRNRLDNKSFFPSVDSTLHVWMVGQAKHYPNTPISTPALRELVGSVELARAKAFADGGLALSGLNVRVCDPVFFLFFTTGEISKDGEKLLKASGVVSMNGAQLAAFLADNGVGTVDDEFDKSAAAEWISSHRTA